MFSDQCEGRGMYPAPGRRAHASAALTQGAFNTEVLAYSEKTQCVGRNIRKMGPRCSRSRLRFLWMLLSFFMGCCFLGVFVTWMVPDVRHVQYIGVDSIVSSSGWLNLCQKETVRHNSNIFQGCDVSLHRLLQSPYSLTVNIPCPPVVTTPEAGAAGNSTEDTLKIPDDQFGPKIMCSEQYRVISINSRFSFPFGNPCLKEFIAGHCFDEGFLVPRIVHYVWFTNHSLDVYTFISVLSAYRFLNPCLILVHADLLPTGVYWRALRLLVPLIVHVQRQPPARVFGKLLGFVQHQADIARLEALREYGGIYLDADQIILKNLDKFRKMEFVMGHESPKNLANSLLISAPHAKFIDVWYQHYRTYSAREWGIHSTFLPFALSRKFPSMITNAGYAFVKPDLPAVGDVWIGHYDWSRNYAIHLYTRSVANWSLFPTQHTLESLVRLNASLGEIARYILFGDKHSCSRCHLTDSECGHYQ